MKELDSVEIETYSTSKGLTEDVYHEIESKKVCENAGALKRKDQVLVENLDTLITREEEDSIKSRRAVTNKWPEGAAVVETE